MIRINLLPYPERKPALVVDFYVFVLFFLVLLVLSGASYYYVNKRIWDLNAKIDDRKKRIAALEGVYREYLTMEKEKKEIEKRLKVVSMIKKGRALPARMLYDLTTLTRDTLWLRSIKKTDLKVQIEGRAIENESIADFTEEFSRLPYVKNAELIKVEEVVEEGLAVKKFVVEAEFLL